MRCRFWPLFGILSCSACRRRCRAARAVGYIRGEEQFGANAFPPLRYGGLFHAAPRVTSETSAIEMMMHKQLTKLMKGDKLAANLPNLLGHCRHFADDLATREPKVMEVFGDYWRLVYALTMRTVGCNEVAADEAMLARTLAIFTSIESTAGDSWRITFPWLWTPGHVKRLWAGGRMYMILSDIIEQRKKTGRRESDAMQMFLDQGQSTIDIVTVSQSISWGSHLVDVHWSETFC